MLVREGGRPERRPRLRRRVLGVDGANAKREGRRHCVATWAAIYGAVGLLQMEIIGPAGKGFIAPAAGRTSVALFV